jgi:hypothetical protein
MKSKPIVLLILIQLLSFWDGNAQTVDTTFMFNDSVVCTSSSNVIKTANQIKILQAQKEYLMNELAAESVNINSKNKELRKLKREIIRAKIGKPLGWIISGSLGFLFCQTLNNLK